MKLNPEKLDEDFMIAKCKKLIRETMEKDDFHQIWIPTNSEKLSLEGRKRAEREIRQELPEEYVFTLDRIGVAHLAKPKRKPVSLAKLLGTKDETL